MTLITSVSMTISEASNKPFTSTIMHKVEVKTVDTGGTLLFSDSPEYVKENGILYTDTVKGEARVLFYHLNESSSNKKLAIIIENVSKKFNTIDITRGATTKPSSNFLKVGKAVQTEYMKNKFSESFYLNKGEKRLLIKDLEDVIMKPGELIYGVYDFNAEYPVKVTILMYPQTANPIDFLQFAQILPKDEQRLRGTFQNMNRTLTVEKIYNPNKDGIMYLMLADNVNDVYKTGIDATDGSEVVNFGNYGINYKINLRTKDDTRICLTPLGGFYAGAMRLLNYNGKKESKVILTPQNQTYFGDKTPKEPEHVKKAREEGLSLLTNYTELAELGTYKGKVSFEYSPPGASYLPVNIILMPMDKK